VANAAGHRKARTCDGAWIGRSVATPLPCDPSLSLTAPTDTTRRNGIAVTKPRRTLRDPRRTERADVVRRASRQAAYLGLDLGNEGEGGRDRSDLERRMLWVCRRYHLPLP
jgi:hypothetical protein